MEYRGVVVITSSTGELLVLCSGAQSRDPQLALGLACTAWGRAVLAAFSKSPAHGAAPSLRRVQRPLPPLMTPSGVQRVLPLHRGVLAQPQLDLNMLLRLG